MLYENISSIYVKKAKCKNPFGKLDNVKPPEENASLSEKISVSIPDNEAALFRLAGDLNPLHMYSSLP
jgi:hypothetical protein